jgi:hypothetical protein
MNLIGLKTELKHWESRVPIAPQDLSALPHSLKIIIQKTDDLKLPFKNRVFADGEYLEAGDRGGATVEITPSLQPCGVILGTKEIKDIYFPMNSEVAAFFKRVAPELEETVPGFLCNSRAGLIEVTDFLTDEEKAMVARVTAGTIAEELVEKVLAAQAVLVESGKAYMFFTHVHKGQKHNMRMLKEFITKKCTLLDYELLHEPEVSGKRTVAYGEWAGIVGALDTLWAYGEHVTVRSGRQHPFRMIRSEKCYDAEKFEYRSLPRLRETVQTVGQHHHRHRRVSRASRPRCLGGAVKLGIAGHRDRRRRFREQKPIAFKRSQEGPHLCGEARLSSSV